MGFFGFIRMIVLVTRLKHTTPRTLPQGDGILLDWEVYYARLELWGGTHSTRVYVVEL